MTEEVRVVVARARIKDSPEIEVLAPKEIRVRANHPLRVQYLYHVEESSRAREEWKFALKSNVGAKSKDAIRSKWNDRWGLPDRFWGSLEQTFTFDEPGTYAAGFQVDAEYERSMWRSGAEGSESRREKIGNFVVRVVP